MMDLLFGLGRAFISGGGISFVVAAALAGLARAFGQRRGGQKWADPEQANERLC